MLLPGRLCLPVVITAALLGCPTATPPALTTPPNKASPVASSSLPTMVSLTGPGEAPARWKVDVVVDDARKRARLQAIAPDLQAIVAEVDRQHDLERSDGELRRFNRTPTRQPWPLDRATLDVVTEYLELGRRTDGAFDVTASPIRALFVGDAAPTAEQRAVARASSGLDRVRVVGGMLQKDVVDLGIDARAVTDAVIARRIVAALGERDVQARYRVAVGDVLIVDGAGLAGPWSDLDGVALADASRLVQARSHAVGIVVDPRSASPVTHDVIGCDVVGRGVDALAAKALAEACLVLAEDGTARLRPRFGDDASVVVRVRRRGSGG